MNVPGDAAASLTDSALPQPARIGPNAATRLAEAIVTLEGEGAAAAVFEAAHLAHYLEDPPQQMIDERDVVALHRAGRQHYGDSAFMIISRLAGGLTGDYLLANRIPRPAQQLLRLLPAGLAGRALARAISAHAWTFVGSGSFHHRPRHGGLLLVIEDSPLARQTSSEQPLCGYFASTFERIFRTIVSPATQVHETRCMATGDDCCEFAVTYKGADLAQVL